MSYTYDEIQNQATAWRTTIPSVGKQWEQIQFTLGVVHQTHFLFVGSGTSLYLAQTAAQSFQEVTGHVSQAVPSSEIFLSPASSIPPDVPVVAFVISRSGSTSEALMAADYLGQHCPNVDVVGLTCNVGTELEGTTRHIVTLPHASERSVVMTQSFTSMLLALQVIASQIATDNGLLTQLGELPDLLNECMPAMQEFAERVGGDVTHSQYIYLGLGPYGGLAQEGTLKLKEMTQTHCEAYNPLEFRHGPISIVVPGTVCVLLEGLRERAYLQDLEVDVKGHGAQVAVLGPYPSPHADVLLDLPEGLSDIARCLLYLPPLQLIAYFRASALDLNPDEPRYLAQVVVLEGQS